MTANKETEKEPQKELTEVTDQPQHESKASAERAETRSTDGGQPPKGATATTATETEQGGESEVDTKREGEETQRFPANELRAIFELADVERTLPNRRFGEPTTAPRGSAFAASAAFEPASPGAESSAGAVRSAVDLGYQVIQEQIQLGRQLAEQLGHGFYERSPLLQVPFGEAPNQLLSLWLELVNTIASGLRGFGLSGTATVPPQPPDLWPWDTLGSVSHPPPSTQRSGDRQRLLVDVASKRRLQIDVELEEGHGRRDLFAHLLNVADPQGEALTGVVFESAGCSHPRLRLKIPDHLRAGTYTGTVIEQGTGRHVGALTVILSD